MGGFWKCVHWTPINSSELDKSCVLFAQNAPMPFEILFNLPFEHFQEIYVIREHINLVFGKSKKRHASEQLTGALSPSDKAFQRHNHTSMAENGAICYRLWTVFVRAAPLPKILTTNDTYIHRTYFQTVKTRS